MFRQQPGLPESQSLPQHLQHAEDQKCTSTNKGRYACTCNFKLRCMQEEMLSNVEHLENAVRSLLTARRSLRFPGTSSMPLSCLCCITPLCSIQGFAWHALAWPRLSSQPCLTLEACLSQHAQAQQQDSSYSEYENSDSSLSAQGSGVPAQRGAVQHTAAPL